MEMIFLHAFESFCLQVEVRSGLVVEKSESG